MKKVIVFLTVMVIVNVAEAATWNVQVNGGEYTGQDVFESDIIGVTFTEIVSGYGGFGDFAANVSVGTYIEDSSGLVNPGWIICGSGVNVLCGAFPTITPNGAGFDVYAAVSGFPSPTGDIMWFDFHVPALEASTDIVISHILGSWNNVFAPNAVADVVLHVVPEPMTFGLLCLGSLVLLRRRCR
jgi:hypothetical protein